MLSHQVLNTVGAESPAVSVGKNYVVYCALAFLQPSLENNPRLPCERGAAFLAALALAADMRPSAQDNILATQSD